MTELNRFKQILLSEWLCQEFDRAPFIGLCVPKTLFELMT